MARLVSKEAEMIVDKSFPVLDHGFVRLVDYMGSDQRIVDAARVSYQTGTKNIREDSALIDYLMRNHHTSPFEQVELVFHMKMPIFVARQLVRHRTASLNELSGRYSIMEEETYIPEFDRLKKQDMKNKQQSSEVDIRESDKREILNIMEDIQNRSFDSYNKMLSVGLSRELSRINLPLSTYTQWYFKIDLNNLFKLLKLRDHDHAQFETRQYASVMSNIVSKVVPYAYEAFERHMKNNVSISSKEAEFISDLIGNMKNTDNPTFDNRDLRILVDKLKSASKRYEEDDKQLTMF